MLLRFGKRENLYHTKLCKELCGQICAKLRTSLVSTENSVLIAPAVFRFLRKTIEAKESGFFRRQLAAQFYATKRTAPNWAVRKTDLPNFGEMCPVLARSMRRRGVQRAIGQNCLKPPSGGEAAKKGHFMNRWRTGENRPFRGGCTAEIQRACTGGQQAVNRR